MNLEKIRRDFPILEKGIIYFDNAAMTLKPDQVIRAMDDYYCNMSSVSARSVHKLAIQTQRACEEARKKVQKFLGAKKTEEIVWTRNTTEAINLVANSLGLKKGDVVLGTDKEHNSNLLPWLVLSKKTGIKHDVVKSKEGNTFDLGAFEDKMSKQVKLVSMVHISNLDGVTNPAKEIIKIAHDHGALVLLDGAQSVPHKEVSVKKLDVDFMAFSIHKMCGPTGMGVLYAKSRLLEKLEPFLVGGDTVQNSTYNSFELLKPPEKFEAGLQNYAGIIGSGAAVDYLAKIGMANIEKQELEVNKTITEELSGLDEISLIGPKDPEKRSGIYSFWVKGMDHHDIALMLSETGNVMVRSGQHCVHSWFNAHSLPGSVRASLYFYNTKEEASVFAEKLKEVLKLR